MKWVQYTRILLEASPYALDGGLVYLLLWVKFSIYFKFINVHDHTVRSTATPVRGNGVEHVWKRPRAFVLGSCLFVLFVYFCLNHIDFCYLISNTHTQRSSPGQFVLIMGVVVVLVVLFRVAQDSSQDEIFFLFGITFNICL